MDKEITIDQTRFSPGVRLKKGTLKMEGRSVLNDPKPFFQPLFLWVDKYISGNPGTTRIDLKFEYINTSSTKWVFEMLRAIKQKKHSSDDLEINWYYETGDEDMYELGEILKSLMNSSFRIIETPE
ncbi:MAG: DUF1987 domain-containing protein [Chlorobi bacterium]|nr:DUF1987 domain-containing protein [Chlorobiota bacterium]